jgi:hypothetical protein
MSIVGYQQGISGKRGRSYDCVGEFQAMMCAQGKGFREKLLIIKRKRHDFNSLTETGETVPITLGKPVKSEKFKVRDDRNPNIFSGFKLFRQGPIPGKERYYRIGIENNSIATIHREVSSGLLRHHLSRKVHHKGRRNVA